MRLVYWLIAVPLLVAVPLFAVSNLKTVELTIWPLPFVIYVPVFVVALVGLAIGFFAGGTVAWLNAGRARARARSAERAVRARDIEIEELRRKIQDAERVSAANQANAPTKGLPVPVGAAPGP